MFETFCQSPVAAWAVVGLLFAASGVLAWVLVVWPQDPTVTVTYDDDPVYKDF